MQFGLNCQKASPSFGHKRAVQNRIEELLEKQQNAPLSAQEEQELDCYEEIDDYYRFVNRTIRNLSLTQIQQAS